jgi:hypothetical protein
VFRRLVLVTTAASVLLTAAPALALEKGELEFAVGADYVLMDRKTGLRDGLGYRGRFGWMFSDRVGVELLYRYYDTEDRFGEAAKFESELELAALNMVFAFGEQGFQPVFLLGAGWADGGWVIEESTNKYDQVLDSGFYWQLGAGVRFRLHRRVGLRVDLLGSRVDLANLAATNLSAGLDVSVIFGKPK